MITGKYPNLRLRRNRKYSWSRKLIQEKKALYNYKADKRQQKWSQNSQLVKVDVSMLPNYIKKNLDKYQRWLET